jgi:hypothetical protein
MAQYNPYAPPQAPPPEEAVRPRAVWAGVPQPWSPGDVLGLAWKGFTNTWRAVFFAQLLALAIQYTPDLLRGAANGAGLVAEGSPADSAWSVINTIGGLGITAFLNAGLTKIYVTAARGQSPALADLFGGGRRSLAMLGMSILYGIVVGVGVLAFIVPGIVLAIGLQIADLFVVDAELGPVAALRASWQVMRGHKVQMFVFNLLSMLVVIAGALACGIGIVAALAVVRIAEAVIYLRVSGRAEPAAAPPARDEGEPPLPLPMV